MNYEEPLNVRIPANSVREFVSYDIVADTKRVTLDVATKRDGAHVLSMVDYEDLDNVLGRMNAKKEAALRALMVHIRGETILQSVLEIEHRNNTTYLPEMWL